MPIGDFSGDYPGRHHLDLDAGDLVLGEKLRFGLTKIGEDQI